MSVEIDGYFCSQSFVSTGGEGGLFRRNSWLWILSHSALIRREKWSVFFLSLSLSLHPPSLFPSPLSVCHLQRLQTGNGRCRAQRLGGSFVIVWERVEWTILLCCPGGWGLLGDLKQVIISSDEKGWQWLSLNKYNEWKHYFRNPHFVYSGSVKS